VSGIASKFRFGIKLIVSRQLVQGGKSGELKRAATTIHLSSFKVTGGRGSRRIFSMACEAGGTPSL
jgi:hypothetical protein